MGHGAKLRRAELAKDLVHLIEKLSNVLRIKIEIHPLNRDGFAAMSL